MSLVLNGNGTIQNLVAGGLPDGSVTADDIASTLDLSGKTVTLPAGVGGKVLQVVFSSTDTVSGTTSTSFVDTPLSASITPISSSSKMLVFASLYGGATRTDQNIYAPAYRFYETTTTTYFPTSANGFGFGTLQHTLASSSMKIGEQGQGLWLHTHGTASALTYKIQYKSQSVTNTCYFNEKEGGDPVPGTSTIILMEIAA